MVRWHARACVAGGELMDLSEWTWRQRIAGFITCFLLGVTLMWVGTLEPPRSARAASENPARPFADAAYQVSVNSTPESVASARPEHRHRKTMSPLSMHTQYSPITAEPDNPPEAVLVDAAPEPLPISEPETSGESEPIASGDTPEPTEPFAKAPVTDDPDAAAVDEPSEPVAAAEPEADPVADAAEPKPHLMPELPDLSKHRPPRGERKHRKGYFEPEPAEAAEIPDNKLADGTWDTSAPGPTPKRPKVTVDAGPDQVVWAGAGAVQLEAIATDGRSATFSWEQTSGPDVRLSPGASGKLELSGFTENRPSWDDDMLSFDVEMTDEAGVRQTDWVRVWVRWAPDLTLSAAPEDRPRSRRRFEELDGLPIAHYTCTVHPTDYPARFAIDSGQPLTFNTVTSAAHEFVYSEVEGRHLYELSVYQSNEEPRTELVIYAQSADQIPAVIQAVVEWD